MHLKNFTPINFSNELLQINVFDGPGFFMILAERQAFWRVTTFSPISPLHHLVPSLRLYDVNLVVSAPSASPAPPYGITVLECVRDSMVLAWKQPTFAGGADITGYFVDYREVIDGVPGQWHEANIKAISERAYRVSRKIWFLKSVF